MFQRGCTQKKCAVKSPFKVFLGAVDLNTKLGAILNGVDLNTEIVDLRP